MLRRGGRTAGLARAWFANVKERKNLINCAKNKLLAAVDIIAYLPCELEQYPQKSVAAAPGLLWH